MFLLYREPIKRIRETVSGYRKLLDILKEYEDNKQICRLSKKKISEIYGLSYTGTCKKLNFLLRYGLIRQVDGGFVRTGKEVLDATPFSLLPRIMLLVLERAEVYSSFKQQAKLLNVSFEDVQTAWGFYSYFFGSKYPDKNELNLLKQ